MLEFINSPRPSPIAGTWYSGDPQQLASQIDAYIAQANVSEEEFPGELLGIVSPHAGHRYSGKTAGYAFKLVQGIQPDFVVILSPFHQYHAGDILTTSYNSYITPLGEIAVAVELMNKVAKELNKEDIPITQVVHDPEHSLEIQLPFLQRAIKGDFQLLPFMVRTQGKRLLEGFANAVMTVMKSHSYLIIASTDLSHFYPLETAQQLDAEMLRRIKALDGDGVLSAELEGVASACGASSVATLIYAAKQFPSAKSYILNYSTSADETGDNTSVVGYGSAAIYY